MGKSKARSLEEGQSVDVRALCDDSEKDLSGRRRWATYPERIRPPYLGM
jgi:hypothetical protein